MVSTLMFQTKKDLPKRNKEMHVHYEPSMMSQGTVLPGKDPLERPPGKTLWKDPWKDFSSFNLQSLRGLFRGLFLGHH